MVRIYEDNLVQPCSIMDSDNQEYIELCIADLEKSIDRGHIDNWSTKDFEGLQQMILDHTGVHLSIATLKRFTGKVSYNSRPTLTTLSAIATFLGFENWAHYVHQNEHRVVGSLRQTRRFRNRKFKMIMMLGLVLLFVLFITNFSLTDESTNTSMYSFSADKMVRTGVPNSVIFKYEARLAGDKPVIIQQSWDELLRTTVSPEENIHTSIYYYPGFFNARLIVGNEEVQRHPLLITTNGWLSLIEQEGVPIYLPGTGTLRNGSLGITTDQIVSSNIPLQPKVPWTAHYFVKDSLGFNTENLILETAIKNEYKEGAAACQHAEVHLLLAGGVIAFPIAAKGCESEILLYDEHKKRIDPRGFGVDFSDWVTLKIEMSGNRGHLFINCDSTLEFNYIHGPRDVVGFRFRFQGAGSVDYVRLNDQEGKSGFMEEFSY